MKGFIVRLMIKGNQSDRYCHLETMLSKKEDTNDSHLKMKDEGIKRIGFIVKELLIIPSKVI